MATGSPSVSCDAVAPSQRGELQRPAERHRKILGVATDAADLRGSTPTPETKRRRRRRDQFQRGLGSLLQGKTMAVGIEVVSPDASWFLKTSVTSVFDFLHSICYVFGVLMSTAELFSVWFWCLLSTSEDFRTGRDTERHFLQFRHRVMWTVATWSSSPWPLACSDGWWWWKGRKKKTAGTGMPFPQLRGWLEDGQPHHAPSYYNRTL